MEKQKLTKEQAKELIFKKIDRIDEPDEWNKDGSQHTMPQDEIEKRNIATKEVAKIFQEQGIDDTTFPEDSWLCGKIRRIIKNANK